MNEDDVRALVREAIERHLGRPRDSRLLPPPTLASSRHASHLVFNIAAGGDVDDGQCVIEPAVRCNHCGFCKSYGH